MTSTKWEAAKAKRATRRRNKQMQPRNDLGFIVKTIKNKTTTGHEYSSTVLVYPGKRAVVEAILAKHNDAPKKDLEHIRNILTRAASRCLG